MSYKEDVAEAKRLVKRSDEDQWRLAELTWNNVRPQGDATHRQWGKDIGVHHSTAGRYAAVWGRFGAARRQDRPPFWDAYAKVQTGDDEATSASARTDRALRAASPAAVAAAVAASPDLQRAIARNHEAREAIEEEGIGVRAHRPYDEGEREAIDRRVRQTTHALGEALDVDEAVEYLRGAASDLAHAVMVAEEFGVSDADGEAEALAKIKRSLRIYEAKTELTDADEDFLASIGIKLEER